MSDRISAGSTGAQLRGDIQSGETGDKRPGFDPALAPLESDSEAGGAGLDGRMADLDRAGQRSDVGRGPDPSFASAMRPPEPATRRHLPRWAWPAAIAVAAVVAIAVLMLLPLG